MPETQSIHIDKLSTEFSNMRLVKPELIKSMEQSLSRFGQLSPIIVRENKDQFQIIDGFKRYHASINQSWDSLKATVVRSSVKAATAMMITYNKNNNSLIDYEEGMILLSLKMNHHMQQQDIAELVGFSVSWVSRRLALVERLESAVKDELKLGVITSTQARDISKLPRGNQLEITKCIIDNGLTTRQTSLIVDEFQKHKNRDKQKYVLDHPLDILTKQTIKTEDDYDSRLSAAGNNLLKQLKRTYRQITFLTNCLLGLTATKLTLADWTVLEHDLAQTKRIAAELFEIIDKNPQ